jgi:hypothetical protein
VVSGRDPFTKPRWWRAYSFTLVTLVLFVVSWVLHLVFQVAEVSNEAAAHGQAFAWSQFWPRFFAATFENWQSEFLQLMWQAAGLAMFLHWGSSQSREGDVRVEAKLDELLRRLPDRRLFNSDDR